MKRNEMAVLYQKMIHLNMSTVTENEELNALLRFKILNCTGFHLIVRIKDGEIIDFKRNMLNILDSNDTDIAGVIISNVILLTRYEKLLLFSELRQRNRNILKEFRIDLSQDISKYILCSLTIGNYNGDECLYVLAIDLTEYKDISEQFAANQSSTKELLDNAPVGVFKSSINGKLLEANEYLAKSLGFSSVADMNLKVKNILTDLYVNPKERQIFIEKMQTSPLYFNNTIKLKLNKGGTITARIIAKIIDAAGQKPYIFGFLENISDFERTQSALFESEQHQKALFEGSVDPIAILDNYGKCIAINSAFEKHFGYNAGSLIGHNLPDTDIYSNGTWELWLSKCNQGGGISGIEYNRKLNDGSITPVRLTISPIVNTQNELTAISLWYHCIQDIKKYQEKADDYFNKLLFLQYSATELLAVSSYDRVVELIVDRIYGLVKNSLVVYSDVNQEQKVFQMKAIRGLDKSMLRQILDRSDINPFKSSIALNDKYLKLYSLFKLVKYEGTFEKFAKGIFSDEFNDFIVKFLNVGSVYMLGVGVGDRVLGVVHIIKRDSDAEIMSDLIETFVNQASLVLERKQTEEKLLEKEREFISVINTSGDIIILLDIEGRIVNINNAALEILQLNYQNCIGTLLCASMSSHLGIFSKILSDDLLTITDSKHYEEEYDNTYYDVRIEPVRDVNGKINQFSIIARNIQSRKEIENTLIKSEKGLKDALEAKDKFFSIISHDLKNPISGFLMLAKTLNSNLDSFEKDELKEMFGLILDSATNIQTLLNNLLDWARTQRGTMQLNQSKFHISESAINLASIFATALRDKNIVLQINIDPELAVYADFNMISTIVRNLVSNAIKFSHNNSTIQINAQSIEADRVSYVILSVEDNGVGISQERIETIFTLGHSQTTLGTADEKGTGIGLILCKEFAELNGGTLCVKSQVNLGTKFFLTLKAAEVNDLIELDWDTIL